MNGSFENQRGFTGHEAEKLGIVVKVKHLVYFLIERYTACGSQKPFFTPLGKGKKAIPLQA
jgi:hypothetical protein